MDDGNVLHKYFFQYSSLWALAEIIVCCKTDHSFFVVCKVFRPAESQLAFHFSLTPCNIAKYLPKFVKGGCRMSKLKGGLPSLPPLSAPSVLADRQAAWELWLLLQIGTTFGTVAWSKSGSKGNREFCRCQYRILSLYRTEFVNDFMKVNCYGNQPF